MKTPQRFPTFIVAGAPKCGTTSLYHYLRQHADIYLPMQKELHFFSHEMLLQNMNGPGDDNMKGSICTSLEQYQGHYANCPEKAVRGEFSPSYLYYDGIASRIRATIADVKLLFILRNPIDKARSQYMHLVRSNRETLDFRQALAREAERKAQGWSDLWRFAESSLYAKHLATYLATFDPAQVKVVFFDDFTNDTQAVLKDICAFIGVDADFSFSTERVYNKSGAPRSKLLARLLSQQNIVKTLFRAITPVQARNFIRLKLIDMNTIPSKEPLPDDVAQQLAAFFREDTRALKALLGRSIPWEAACDR